MDKKIKEVEQDLRDIRANIIIHLGTKRSTKDKLNILLETCDSLFKIIEKQASIIKELNK